MGLFELNAGLAVDTVSDQVAPPFLQGPNGAAFLTVIGRNLDQIRYRSACALANRLPLLADPSALYYLGLDRLITQAAAEASTTFAIRLSQYLDTWRVAGTNWSVLREVLAQVGSLISPTPESFVVTDFGYWSYYFQGATTSTPPVATVELLNWNWDSFVAPSYYQSYWRCFLGVHSAA